MKFSFKNIFNKTLKPTWEYELQNFRIWKLLPAENNVLVCEAREPTLKEMHIFGIDVLAGRIIFNKISFDEKWWVALENIIGHFAILHKFPKPDMPNTLGVYVINTQEGGLLWKNDNIKILDGQDNTAIAKIGNTFERDNFIQVSLQDGTTIQEFGNDFEKCNSYLDEIDNSHVWEQWISSNIIKPNSENFTIINSILEDDLKEQRGSLNYAEHLGLSIITASERSNKNVEAMLSNLLNTYLFIYNRDGTLVHKELISEDNSNHNEDTFFIWNSILIYIKNSNKLIGIDLTSI